MSKQPTVASLTDPWTCSSGAALSLSTRPSLDTYSVTTDDPFTPTSSNVRTPTSTTNSNINVDDSQSFKPTQQWDFSYSPDFNTQGLPDISSMMFPSEDPFAYPTQPMMTLEDGQFAQSPTVQTTASGLFNMPSTTSSNAPYDDIEAQLFGPLPPYLNQGQMEQQPDLILQDLERQMAMAPGATNDQMMSFSGGAMGPWASEQQQSQQPMPSLQHQTSTQDRMTESQQREVMGGNLFGDWNGGWRNQSYGQG